MRSKNDRSKCLSVKNGWKSAGVALIIWTCQNPPSAAQLWDARYMSTPRGYLLVNRNSGLVVAVSGGSNDNGTLIIQWPWGDQPEQVWNIQRP